MAGNQRDVAGNKGIGVSIFAGLVVHEFSGEPVVRATARIFAFNVLLHPAGFGPAAHLYTLNLIGRQVRDIDVVEVAFGHAIF